MTHEQEPGNSQAVAPYNPLSALPLMADKDGNEVINWNALMVMPATPELVAGMLGTEITRLSQSEDPSDIEQVERLQNSINGVLKIYDSGLLPSMRDVHELTSLVMERGPKLSDVARVMVDKGYTAEGTAYLYDVKDTLDITLDQADEIFKTLGFSHDDDQDISLVDSALEKIEEVREIRFRHTAAEILVELIRAGVSIKDILDGQVY